MKPLLRRKTTPVLSVALDRYLHDVSPLKRGKEQEISIVKRWLETHIAQREIGRIKPNDLIRIRDEWLLTVKPATVIRRLSVLSHLYTVAIKDWGVTDLSNPVLLVRRPSSNDARDRRLFERITLRGVDCPANELDWIIESSQSKQLPTILTLAVETAMRRSEICMIKREHVDLMHGVVHLPHTKNGTKRDVPLTPIAKDALRKYLADKNATKGRIFTITPSAATKSFIRALRVSRRHYEQLCKQHGRRAHKAYFYDLRLHDLRHEATSRLATVFEMHELAKITGHKDTRMLLRYYHPKGYELTKKLLKSPLGKRQTEHLRSLEQ